RVGVVQFRLAPAVCFHTARILWKRHLVVTRQPGVSKRPFPISHWPTPNSSPPNSLFKRLCPHTPLIASTALRTVNMPRAFLIKKHFGVNPISRTKKSRESPIKHDTDVTNKNRRIEHTIPGDWTPPRTPSDDLVTTPPPPPLISSQRNPLTSLVDPFEANTWHKSVIPPYVPFSISSVYPAFTQQSDYYRGAALYSLIPNEKKAESIRMDHQHEKKNPNLDVSSFIYNLWDAPRYQCPDCNKSYSTLSGLNKHQQFHCVTQAQKSFSCKYCDKIYVSLGALKMHIRTHTLPCKCKLCGKAFSRPWLLQGHVRTHTGEKPFACQHCNRAFADRSNLRAHLQTHSDVKKYSCTNCSKTFSRMSLLVKHKDGSCSRD
uniref:C2H2-type domain-containing protein n=1 Tax=Strigamia maritima TaxID=126957 RepID=T1ILA8_STRMM